MLPKIGPHRQDKVLELAAGNPGLQKIDEQAGTVLYKVQ